MRPRHQLEDPKREDGSVYLRPRDLVFRPLQAPVLAKASTGKWEYDRQSLAREDLEAFVDAIERRYQRREATRAGIGSRPAKACMAEGAHAAHGS